MIDADTERANTARSSLGNMPTRNNAEKARIEKKIKKERIIMIALILLAASVFVAVSIIVNKNGSYRIEPQETPEPSEDPSYIAALGLKELFGGEISVGEKYSVLSFISGVDGAETAVRTYLDSGLVCVKITRKLETESKGGDGGNMFSGIGLDIGDDYPAEDGERGKAFIPAARELADCLASVYPDHDRQGLEEEIVRAIVKTALDGAKEASFIFSGNIVKLSYSASDSLLTLICEPV